MHKRLFHYTGTLSVCFAALLSGCAQMPGDVPSDPPPRLVNSDNKLIWENVSSFGKVPPALQKTGDQICKLNGMETAIGYHPRAINRSGKPDPDGGFLCQGKFTDKVAPSDKAPKLITGPNGEVDWDHPAYFGSVPDDLKDKGNEVCKSTTDSIAIGYHPKAIGLDNKPLPKGAYLCSSSKTIGTTQSASPPKMIITNGKMEWDDISKFGPVPTEMRAQGDQVCQSAGMHGAIGYHAKAINAQGQPFPSGAFVCSTN